jgi:hypothetical protein
MRHAANTVHAVFREPPGFVLSRPEKGYSLGGDHRFADFAQIFTLRLITALSIILDAETTPYGTSDF